VQRNESDGGLFVSDPIRDEESLSADLGALRSALLEVRAPDDEALLRRAALAPAAARAITQQPSAARPTVVAAARARRGPSRRAVALAAAAAVSGIAVLVAVRDEWVLRTERAERAEQAERAVQVADSSRATALAPAAARTPVLRSSSFRPIAFSRGLSASESYSVVRVRIELASSSPGTNAPSASIEADLLVGEDGLAHAIRFDSADTLPVYAASGPVSGERR
jgi:hypothetical protein